MASSNAGPDALPKKKDKKDGPSAKEIFMYSALLIGLIGFILLVAFMMGAFDDVGGNSKSFDAMMTDQEKDLLSDDGPAYIQCDGFYFG